MWTSTKNVEKVFEKMLNKYYKMSNGYMKIVEQIFKNVK